MDSSKLMQLADTKFRVLKERGLWNTPSDEEEKILALQTEIRNQSKEISRLKKGKTNPNRGKKRFIPAPERQQTRKSEKPEWMKIRPKDDALHKPRMWNNKQWWFCHPDTGGKCDGEYRRHKPSECEGKSFLTKNKKAPPKNQEKKLKIAEALAAVTHDDATESDCSGYASDSE